MSLTLDVFNSGYVPVNGGPGWESARAATWSASVVDACTGDAFHNNIHVWLWNSTPESRQNWLSTTDKIADMNPATIIVGHKDLDAADDNAACQITQSRS
jgi:hypothetical protein